MHGLVDEKTDVFAFGVLLLELMTGRRAVDSNSRQSLVIWVCLHNLFPYHVFKNIMQMRSIYVANYFILFWPG